VKGKVFERCLQRIPPLETEFGSASGPLLESISRLHAAERLSGNVG
jgi:hypothetical protein